MTENDTNRRWLVGNRLAEKRQRPEPNRDAETLLYYKSQLEAELSYVQRQLVALGVSANGGV